MNGEAHMHYNIFNEVKIYYLYFPYFAKALWNLHEIFCILQAYYYHLLNRKCLLIKIAYENIIICRTCYELVDKHWNVFKWIEVKSYFSS